MVTFLSHFKIKPDAEKAFIELAKELQDATLANEKDCLQYRFYKMREPHKFAVFESFASEEADHAHQQTDHFKRIGPAMIDCIDGTYERIYLDPLPGS